MPSAFKEQAIAVAKQQGWGSGKSGDGEGIVLKLSRYQAGGLTKSQFAFQETVWSDVPKR